MVASLGKKLALSASSLVVLFGLLEGGLRLFGFDYPRQDAPIVVWNPKYDAELASEDALHRSETRQLWGPRPGAAFDYGVPEVINERGYRGPLLSPEPTPGVLRVATLGDSSTFGLGVPYEQCYSSQLARELQAAGRRAEVLDGGVIGFTVRQGLERYRELVRPHHPQVVVAAFGAINEHHLGAGGNDEFKIARSIERSGGWYGLQTELRDALRIGHLLAWMSDESVGGRDAIRKAWQAEQARNQELLPSTGEIDWAGVRRVSLQEFPLCLAALQREVEADGARLVLVSMPRMPTGEKRLPVLGLYTEALVNFAKERQLLLCNAHDAFLDRRKNGEKVLQMFLPSDDVHPSPIGHELLAKELAAVVLAAAPAQ